MGRLSWRASVVMLVIVFLGVSALCNVVPVGAANTVVAVTPSSTSVTVGQTFTVNVTLDFAANLWAFQFDLHFDKTKLEATAIDDGGYLNTPITVFSNNIDNTNGVVSYAVSSHLPAVAKTGGSPPPLATIHFKAIASGFSNLHLSNTILVDNNTMTIPSTTCDGQVTITGGAPPVGGIWEPVNMLALLFPWICLSLAIGASGALFGLFRKRFDRDQ